MDDILAKHLAKTLLFKEKNNTTIKKTDIISDHFNYKLIDGKYYINTEGNISITEKIGFWKNKAVVKVNGENFVIMESSKTMIPLRHVSKEEFDKNFTISQEVAEKKKEKSEESRPLLTRNDNITVSKEFKPVVRQKNSTQIAPKVKQILPRIKSQVEKDKSEPIIQKSEDVSTDKYINDIKRSTNSEFSNNFEEDAEENEETNSFFDMLDKKKDDPRVKKFFNYHADAMKKEFTQIIEKVKTSQMARAMESGGGTNAVQYANGGIMNGTLNVTNQIISENVTDTSGRQLVFKKTFDITGNGSNHTFTFTHNFNTKDILINVYDAINYELVFVSSVNTDLNNTRITFPNDLNVGQNYRVILLA